MALPVCVRAGLTMTYDDMQTDMDTDICTTYIYMRV